MTLRMTPDNRKINSDYSSTGFMPWLLMLAIIVIPAPFIYYIATQVCQISPGRETATLYGTLLYSVRRFSHIVCTHSVDAVWICLFLLLTAILIVATFREICQDRDKKTLSSFALSMAFLVPISVCFFYIFSFPTMRPKLDFKASIDAAAAEPVYEPTSTLITAEHHQALEEIKMRIEHDDDWFHIKFLLIGGLFTLFGTLLVLERIEIGREIERKRKDIEIARARNERAIFGRRMTNRQLQASATPNPSQFGFEEMLGNPIASTIFAVVFIVAVIIDMHVRTSYMVVHQLANWILTHVDPILNCRKSIFASYCETSPYMPWEQFLRISDGNLKGMHEDFVWNLFQTPHIHFTTWMLYVSYLLMLFWLCGYGNIGQNKASSRKSQSGPFAATMVLFVMAHMALGVFAFTGHAAPGTFYEKVLVPHAELWISAEKAGYVFVIVWLVMTGLAALRVFSIMPSRRQLYAKLSGRWDSLPFRRSLFRSQCNRAGRLFIWLTSVGVYLAAMYVLVIAALGVVVLANIHNHREREGLGYVIVGTMVGKNENEEEHDVKIAVVVEAPKKYLARLKEYDVLGGVQANVIAEKANPYQYERPQLNGLDEFRLEENIWYNERLEGYVRKVICEHTVCKDQLANGEVTWPNLNKEIIHVYFEMAGHDEDEQYELPEFVVADLNNGGRNRNNGGRNLLKVKFIVVSPSVNVRQIKKNEAKVVDSVLRLLHDLTPKNITSRDELRCKVRNEIIAAMSHKSSPETCNVSYDGSANQMVKEVLVKELVLYEPRVLYGPGLSEEERRK